MVLEQQPLGPVANLLPRGQDEITWLPGLHEAFPPEATRKRLSHLSALDPVGLKADSFLEGLEKRVFGCGLPRPLRNRRHARGASRVDFSGDCPWSPQQMTWTSRPSSQSRKVSRVGRGTVQTSSQMITRGTNFCLILSGVQSVWPLQRKKL